MIYYIKKIPVIFLFFVCFFYMLTASFFQTSIYAADYAAEKENHPFELLKQRLVNDGFNEVLINKIYDNPEIEFNSKSVSQFFKHNESKLNYGRFKADKLIKQVRQYIQKNKKDFVQVEEKYGVNKKIIAAIILVETRLGTYTGKSVVLTTLSTMATLSDQAAKNKLWQSMSQKGRLSIDDFNKKARKRSKWAYNELKAFIRYADRENIDSNKIMGSYAGAMGIAQFMPTNILTLAIDGNNDGKIDMFNHADAIHSIANFLKYHGWRPGMDRKQSAKVIYCYNHSKYYVNTILDIANIL